jgi:LmbE family N-acetylglucosaminyl deacetylase
LVVFDKTINPDIIFCPSLHDMHQDHSIISQEATRAFKKKTIFGYEIPWNNLTFDYTCFIHFDQKHLDKKLLAISQYISQKIRMYGGLDFISNLAVVRGIQSGGSLAEAFEIIRLNIK